jgi:hypothetical protein
MTEKRYMRVKATGAWVKDLEWGGSALEIPPENHCADIAKALDMDPAELEAVDRTSDPRKDTFVSLPPKEPSEAPLSEAELKQLRALLD